MGGGGGSNQVQKSEVTQSTLPEYARPYFEGLMTRANANLTTPYIPYGYTQDKTTGDVIRATDPTTGKPVDATRIADFTQQQRDVQNNILGMQSPGQFGAATNLANTAGLGSIAAGQYNPGQFGFQQVNAQQVNAPNMQAAQTQFQANLERFQMQAPDQFGQQQTNQYMSPYMQNVVDTQKREAVRDARQGQIMQDLGAARQGTYGGSRQLLAGLERERNLGTQLGDIQARGSQSAFENAQAQFERDRGATMTAQQANLQAALGVQELGTNVGLQTALANLSNEQQARVNNQATQFQAQGMNADNALRAALSNQQAGLDVQRMGEQSRQFGSQQGLAGLAQANQAGQTLANIGSAQSQADQARFGLQTSTAAQQQALDQQRYDTRYQNFLRERDYPMEQLQQYSSLLRGVPVTPNSTTTTYAPSASLGSQLVSGGLGAAALYNTANRAGVI
jgi:hypothetical protein